MTSKEGQTGGQTRSADFDGRARVASSLRYGAEGIVPNRPRP